MSERLPRPDSSLHQDDSGAVTAIDRAHDTPAATVFSLATSVRLLHLASGWVTRAGGNQTIVTGARSRARDWARAIHRAHSDVDGLVYPSSVWGPGTCMVSDPALDRPLARAAEDLGAFLLG